MKYITFTDLQKQVDDCVVVFSDNIVHKEMAAGTAFAGRRQGARLNPVSAGFCCVKDGEVKVYGRSESLDLDPSPKADKKLLNRMLQ